MKWRKALTLTAGLTGPLLLAGAGAAMAAASGTPGFDIGGNALINIVENNIGPTIGALGMVGLVHSLYRHSWGEAVGTVALAGTTAGVMHNYGTGSVFFGGAAAANIQLVAAHAAVVAHHIARLAL